MRHARAEDLDRVDGLLARLREVDGVTERSRGVFYRRSKAFLHFHEDSGDIWCDVRLDGVSFERRNVTTAGAQRTLVADVRRSVGAG